MSDQISTENAVLHHQRDGVGMRGALVMWAQTDQGCSLLSSTLCGITNMRKLRNLSSVILPDPAEAGFFTCPLPPNWLLVLFGEGLSVGQFIVEQLRCFQE